MVKLIYPVLWGVVMEKQTLDQLATALKAVEKDLAGRVAELAAKSSSGELSQEERADKINARRSAL
jgi:hypothetical protein